MKFTDFLPYIASGLTAVIAGVWSYLGSRKQAKEDIARLEKQHELDIEKEREMFAMEKEKIQIEHLHQIELIQKEAESNANSEILKTVISETMKNPDIQKRISEGARNGKQKSSHIKQ